MISSHTSNGSNHSVSEFGLCNLCALDIILFPVCLGIVLLTTLNSFSFLFIYLFFLKIFLCFVLLSLKMSCFSLYQHSEGIVSCLTPSVLERIFIFILFIVCRFYTLSETHVGIKIVQTLAIYLLTSIHPF